MSFFKLIEGNDILCDSLVTMSGDIMKKYTCPELRENYLFKDFPNDDLDPSAALRQLNINKAFSLKEEMYRRIDSELNKELERELKSVVASMSTTE